MSEAVAGLALAASILQVLDYGRQFVTTAWKLYDSGVDKVEGLTILQRLSNDLDSTLQSAKRDSPAISAEVDKEISTLANESRAASVKIQEFLSRASITLDARRTKRKALRAAFVTVWNRDEIRSLEIELEGINRRLTLALLASLRKYTMSSLSEQRVLLKQIVEKTHDSKESLEDQKLDNLNIRSEVVSHVSRMAGRSDPWTLTNSIGEEIRSVEHDNDQVIPDFDPCNGLDEFKGHHQDLITYFKGLIAAHPVKICFASRPWVVFEGAFREQPSLMLEHLTHDDRMTYVRSHFKGDSNFERIQTLDPVFSYSLFDKIVNNSEGVFLWVRLVVESLLDGMREGDRVSDLQKRLDAIPKDLEDLFQWMLDDLSPNYMDHAAQYFQLIACGPTPLPTILLSFADEEDDYASVTYIAQ
ncbi:hypothetical protein SLS64_000144 [Diaporthe eres]